MSRIIVANATPVVSFCAIGREDILQQIFSQLHIAHAVDTELRAAGKPGADFSDREWVNG